MANIPSDATTYNGHKYYLYSDKDFTWDEAKAYCEKLGGHLVTITDEDEQQFIENLLSEKGSKNSYWIGCKLNSSDEMAWITGEDMTYSNWSSGEPDNYRNEQGYGLIVRNKNYGLKLGDWGDINVSGNSWAGDSSTIWGAENFGFICEWEPEKNSWTLSGTTAKYGSSDETLVTVKGVKSLDGLSINDNVVTVAKSSLNAKTVTISKGYTLALADDVSKSTTKNSWSLSGSTATYKQTKSVGYTLANNKIIYNKKSTETLFTVSGVKSTKGLSLNDNVVTVSKSSLNAKTVTISKGYTLALADDVDKPTTKNAAWSYSNSTATYKQTKTAGYTLANNKIIYNKKSTENLLTISGVKSTKGLSLNDNVVTVSKSSLNAKKVTISGTGYTLALADDVDEPTTKKSSWTLNGTTANYKSSAKTAGYTLASNGKSITYSKATTASTLATVKGVKSTSGLKVSSGKITLKNSALKNKVTISGGYEFDFASDYKSATITGSKNSDTITARGKKIKINGGAGDDVIKIFGSGTVTGGDGADIFHFNSSSANVISDYAAEDKILIASGTVNVTTDGDDVIINKKITVEGGADKAVTYIENGIEKTFKTTPDDVIYSDDGTGATLTTRYTADNFTPTDYSKYKDTLLTIDASAVDYNLTIEGNKRANKITGTGEDDYIDGAGGKDTILGGDGKDTLVGSAGNDCLYGGIGNDSLWGGAGDDTLFGGDGDDIFLYKDGDDKDTIADFESVDKIMILCELGEYNVNGSDVTFEVGSGKIVIQNGADKNIELVDGYGNHLKHYSPKN